MTSSTKATVVLDGNSMSPDLLVRLGYEQGARIAISDDARERIRASRRVIDEIVASGRVVYGVNTGFGKFQSTVIAPDQLEQLQVNLIRSHCAGVGTPLDAGRARMMLALRINILCRGHSGIRLETVQTLVEAFNAGVVPHVPMKGTVGASGDLAPLSHLALGMMGEGLLATVDNQHFRPAEVVLARFGIRPITLGPKEGLALINGTQFISAVGAEAVVRARHVARVADVVLALTHEALKCTTASLTREIHAVRPHKGQQLVAQRLRGLLLTGGPSEIRESHTRCGRVQDAYSIRCAPQVHGIACDVIEWVYGVLGTELNCATDNPLVFADGTANGTVLSGGNFHGEYPGKALDMLAIGVHEIGNISERRIERLNNPSLSELPAFLVRQGGLNSGFMIAHCTAAALVSENKVLCHPATVDSISTSAAQEDHVSMGGFAARKALDVVANVETIVAIELLCAAQGVELLRPLRTTPMLERVMSLVRRSVPPWTEDRNVSVDIEAAVKLVRSGQLWHVVDSDLPQEARFHAPPLVKPFTPASKL